MSEKLIEGPLWDLKYGDNPATGDYEYVGHRIETPNGELFVSEITERGCGIAWTTGLGKDTALAKVRDYTQGLPDVINYFKDGFVMDLNSGDSIGFADSFYDERVETPQFFIRQANISIEIIRLYMEQTASPGILPYIDELLKLSEVENYD